VEALSAAPRQPPAHAEADAEEDDLDQEDGASNCLSNIGMFKMANCCVSVLAKLNRVALSSSIKHNMSTGVVEVVCLHTAFAAIGF
jgi:hypothetical protein